jgi:hypothetical protein
MQSKTIKSAIRKKITAWADSVSDPAVKEIIKQQTIVTGGCIVSMLLGETVNDYDVYFRTGEGAFAVAKYYVEKFVAAKLNKVPLFIVNEQGEAISKFDGGRFRIMAKSAGVASENGESVHEYQYFEQTDPEGEKSEEYLDDVTKAASESLKKDSEFRPIFISANAVTLSDRIQFVIRFYGEADEIHKNYDFVHCTNYWQSWDGTLELRKEALESILAKVLNYQGSRYPICSVIRTRKFLKRDWRISAGQYLKMCMQISELDLKDPKVLEDQLTGVDAAYFDQLIRYLRQDMEKNGTESVDSAYLAQLIDRMF